MLLIFLGIISCSLQFNLDTQSAHIFKSENGLFGFSVALHQTSSDKYVLVGSPNAQTDQDGVVEGGAVFKCSIPRLDNVSSIPVECSTTVEAFNDGGNVYYDQDGQTSTGEDVSYTILAGNKTLQFLGVTLAASNSWVIVCGHRYEHRFLAYETSFSEDPPRQLVGRCLVTDQEFYDKRTFMPCNNNEDSGYESYGYCQAGTSMALHDDELLIGVPGRHKALGGAFAYTLNDMFDAPAEMIRIPTPTDEDTIDKYIGYSSVICNMDGDDRSLEYVFGGPRGAMYKGEVKIYSATTNTEDGKKVFEPFLNLFDPSIKYNFVGEQMGSYFGHSLACIDVNGDGYDDLVVGAPWYTDYEDKQSGIAADTGRIYIYYGSDLLDELHLLEDPVKITGTQPNAAFGFSIASAGDMNGDQYNDIFVGAPYFDDGEGAVFLFLGGEDGLQEFHSQLIKPSSLNVQADIQTFGWSISGDKDMDGNGYPDVAIGAYKSGHVAFIRSKSIIDVLPELNFSLTEIRPDAQTIDIPGTDARGPGTVLTTCLSYKTKNTSEALQLIISSSSLRIKFKVNLDLDNTFPRISFEYATKVKYLEATLDINLTDEQNTKFCSAPNNIYFDNSTRDVQPIKVSIEASIDRDFQPSLTSIILNQEIIREAATGLNISSKCHPTTGVCHVDMRIELGKVIFKDQEKFPTLVFGFVNKITQIITIANTGTDEYNYAYNILVNFTIPDHLEYLSVAKIGSLTSDVGCNNKAEDPGILICRIPDMGPINEQDIMSQTFGIVFALKDIARPIDLRLRAEVIAMKPSVDSNTADNTAETVIAVKELAELSISGGSSQSRLPFNNQYTIINKAIGSPQVIIRHDYSVELSENALKSSISNITVNLYWPQQVNSNGLYIVPLYNITMPEHVNVDCQPSLQSLYPYQVVGADSKSFQLTDELVLPESVRSGEIPKSMDCVKNRSSCEVIRCNIDKISRGSAHLNGFKVSLYAKVHEANLYNSPGLNITSFAEIASVHDGLVLPIRHTASAVTELYASKAKSRNYLWIIIGSIIGGLLFLLLIILALWKIGFFKRKQPPTVKADKVTDQIDLNNM